MTRRKAGRLPGEPSGEQTARVKALLAQGLSDKEIAVRLDRSRSTIEHHVAKLYRQAGLFGKAESRRFMIWILTGRNSK